MRHEHIVDGWWEMPGEPVPALGWPGTKNGESHRVWLPKVAQACWPNWDGEPAASCSPARAAVRSTASTGDARGLRKLGVERATPHDLRRTHGSTITALGFGRDAMNRIQNHKEGGIASVYDRHGYAEETKRVMERWRPRSSRWQRAGRLWEGGAAPLNLVRRQFCESRATNGVLRAAVKRVVPC